MASTLDLKNFLSEIDEARSEKLRLLLDEFYPQDIAEEYRKLDSDQKLLVFDLMSAEQGAAVLVELDENEILNLFKELSDSRIVSLANHMELDDAADIIGLLDDERMIKILENIQRPYELKELLSYDPNTCGGIMTPSFISVRADLKVAAALRYVRLKAKQEDNIIIYVYVTDKFGKLAGVISLIQLFLAADNDPVLNHINDEVIAVKTTDDQEVAAELISKYRFLAVPVINEQDQLMGIITFDDVVEVIQEETTEDIYQSSGINVESESNTNASHSLTKEYFGAYKARTPWLVITLLGQYLAASLIASYDITIAAIPIAISFMPLLSGLSGNIGNQSSTIIVRGISTGELDANKSSQILIHELIISLSIGVTCGLITAALSFYVYHNNLLSILIGLSLVLSMVLAVALGTITPFMFKKLNLDPATASGPLITTIIDIISFFLYLTLITKFIKVLI